MRVHRRCLEVVLKVRADVGSLLAGAAHVTRGDGVLVGEAMVELDDAVVTVVVVDALAEIVICRCGSALRISGIEAEKVERNGIYREIVGLDERRGGVDPCRGGCGVEDVVVRLGKLLLVGNKEEGAVVKDGAAEGSAKLVVADLGLARVRKDNGRERGEIFVAVEVEEIAVKLV